MTFTSVVAGRPQSIVQIESKGVAVPVTSTEQIRDQFDSLSLEQAEVKVIASPSLMAYEARFALQQIKDHVEDPSTLAEIIEPLARAVGWAEASAYLFNRQAVPGSVGAHVPTGNGNRQVGN